MMKNKLMLLATILGIVSCFTACGNRNNGVSSQAVKNAELVRQEFYVLHGNDLEINKDSEEWGDMNCGECTYYEFDSYAIGGSTDSLFHNMIVIYTDAQSGELKKSWFYYDINNKSFANYYEKHNPHNHLKEHE